MVDWLRLLTAFLSLLAVAPAARAAEVLPMFDWLPTECAPTRFPMRLIEASLVLPTGARVAVPSMRNVSNGWGSRGAVEIRGPAEKPVPARLEITWFSYTERKFFQGTFQLPHETMGALFAKGVPEDRQTGKPAPFERIIVGVAPEGVVSVWMAAGAEVVEVANFQAAEAQLPWNRVIDNPHVPAAEYITTVLQERLGKEGLARLAREGVPRGAFQSYRRLYRWRPWVTGVGTPEAVQIRSLNGENAFIGRNGAAIPRDLRPVPSQIDLDWRTPEGVVRVAKITFDETETLAAFQKLGRGDTARQLALHLETSRTGVAVSLRDERFVLPLEKATVELLRR